MPATEPGPTGSYRLGQIIGASTLGGLVAWVRALVIAHLWQWFLSDPYHLVRIGVIPTAGALLILGFLSSYIGSNDRTVPAGRDGAVRLLAAFAVAGVAMLIGLVLVQFR